MTRRLIAFILVSTLLLGGFLPSAALAGYANASEWAKPELEKAAAFGMIPRSLHDADMTQPITREEFAELAVLLYEKSTAKTAEAVSPNPFTDTENPQVLKAFALKIVNGTSATTFSPRELTNREQVATMLSRTVRAISPDGDYTTTGAPTFTDQQEISSWALEHVLYMAKLGVIKGSNGAFMPRAVTPAQIASGYATTTREQAVAMSVRSYAQMEAITAPAPQASAADSGLVGSWGYSHSITNISMVVILTFNSDGTYAKGVGSATPYQVAVTSFHGNYKVVGEKILFYNRMKGYSSGSDAWDMMMRDAILPRADGPVEDEELTFTLEGNQLTLGSSTYTRGD